MGDEKITMPGQVDKQQEAIDKERRLLLLVDAKALKMADAYVQKHKKSGLVSQPIDQQLEYTAMAKIAILDKLHDIVRRL